MKQELVTRALYSLALVAVAAVVGPPLLRTLWETFFKKNNGGGGNLEAMIARKEKELRKGLAGPSTGSSQQETKSSGKKTLADVCAQAASRAAKAGDKQKQKAWLDVIKLYDQLQWGDAQEWRDIQKNLKSKYQIQIETSEITKLFRHLSQDNFLWTEPPTLDGWLGLLAGNLFFQALVDGGETGRMLDRRLAQKWSMDEGVVKKAVLFVAHKNLGKEPSGLYSKLESGELPVSSDRLLQACSKLTHKYFKDPEHFLALVESDIKDQAFIFDSLNPLPACPKKDKVKWALKVFGLSQNANGEAVKKRYKVLATKKHPDRLSGHGLSEIQMKRASANFSLLQEAYDILKKELS